MVIKPIILVVNSVREKNAGAFLRELQNLNGRIDGIVLLQKAPWIFRLFRKFLRPAVSIRMTLEYLGQKLAHQFGMASMKDGSNRWLGVGENSWDLLNSGIDLERYAHEHQIPIYKGTKLTPDMLAGITSERPSLFILYGGGILRQPILDMPTVEFLNAHMGSVPRYRGMNVIEWAVYEGYKPEVSVMVVNQIIDGGDVVFTSPINIDGADSIAALRKRGYEHCARAMAEAAYLYSRGQVTRIPQVGEGRSYYRMHPSLRDVLQLQLKRGQFSVSTAHRNEK